MHKPDEVKRRGMLCQSIRFDKNAFQQEFYQMLESYG
jgi:hypothetical protein